MQEKYTRTLTHSYLDSVTSGSCDLTELERPTGQPQAPFHPGFRGQICYLMFEEVSRIKDPTIYKCEYI